MKRLFLLGSAAVLVACAEQPTQPVNVGPKPPALTVLTPPGVNLLACFTDASGLCTLSADHKKATLANTSGDGDGDMSGVYSYDLTVYGQYLTDITELSYTYKSLNSPAHVPTPGELIYEIPIDNSGFFWAHIDAAYCGGKSGATVNIVTMANCGISDGSTWYPNWAAFLIAYPEAKVDNGSSRINIVSQRAPSSGPETWQISNVKFGKTGLICLDERSFVSGGTCTLGSNFKTATLANTSDNPEGDLTGVFSRETTGYGLFLSNIHDLWYKYSGPVPTPGDLIYFIPVDGDGNGTTDIYAWADAASCRGTPNGAGTVFTVNITKDAACEITDQVNPPYPNWAAFAAAYPNARTAAADFDNLVFLAIVAQRDFGAPAATWNILDAKWGAKGK